MKHVFIVNPAAGTAASIKEFAEKLSDFAKGKSDITVYETRGIGDARVAVKNFCGEAAEETRIYVCGGDGTLGEAANGLMAYMDGEGEHQNIELACIPLGTGNDFVRNFGVDFSLFLDIEAQMNGKAVDIDLVKCTEKAGEDRVESYSINMCNIGFDCNAADKVNQLKSRSIFHGHGAYLRGVAGTLVKKEGAELDIIIDDGTNKSGKLLLAAIGNGAYCGGGVKALTKAAVDDGLLDVCIVNNVSRLRFLSLFPSYKKGTHLEKKCSKKIFTYRQVKKVKVRPIKDSMKICTEGEISTCGTMKFEIVPKALRFSVPVK